MPNIVFLLCLFSVWNATAQDSLKRTPPPIPSNHPGAAVGNPELTVAPIILPAQAPVVVKPRKKTAADSLRLMTLADSLAKQVLSNAARSVYSVQPKPTVVTPPAPPPPVVVPKDTPKVAVTPPPPPVVVRRDTPTVATAPPSADTSRRTAGSDNPFDVLKGAAAADSLLRKNASTKPSPTEALMSPVTYSRNFPFWLLFSMLVLLVVGLQISRGVLVNVMQALINDSHFRLIYREQLGWGNLPYLVMYGLFWFNAAIFVFLAQQRFNIPTGFSQYTTFTIAFLGISVAFCLKHFILYIIASVFPITKEVKLYNFIIIIAGIVIGLILAPINIFLAFVSTALSSWLVYLGIGVIVGVYLIRYLRSLFVSGSLLMLNQFHFLLYLCTVELAPAFILLKMVLLQTSSK